LEQSIPIFDDEIWPHLSVTKNIQKKAFGWAQTANLRSSLRLLNEEDGKLLSEKLLAQKQEPQTFELSPEDKRRLTHSASVRTINRAVVVEVPADEVSETNVAPEVEAAEQPRESHKIQATLRELVPRWDSASGFPERIDNA
jgi:hypothetical protein